MSSTKELVTKDGNTGTLLLPQAKGALENPKTSCLLTVTLNGSLSDVFIWELEAGWSCTVVEEVFAPSCAGAGASWGAVRRPSWARSGRSCLYPLSYFSPLTCPPALTAFRQPPLPPGAH